MVTFDVWYYPFSFDDADAVKCQIKVYRDGSVLEVIEYFEILDEEKLNIIKQRKRDKYEVCQGD